MKNILILMLLLLAACQSSLNNFKSNNAPNVTNEKNDPASVATHYNQLAKSFLQKKDLVSAEKNVQESIRYAKQANSTTLLARDYVMYGNIKMQQNDPISAKEQYLNAIAIAEKHHLQQLTAQAYKGLGIAYAALGDYTIAEKNVQESITYATKANNMSLLAHDYITCGNMKMQQADPIGAKEQYLSAIAIGEQQHLPQITAPAYKGLGMELLKIYELVQADLPKICSTTSAMLQIASSVQMENKTYNSNLGKFRDIYNNKCVAINNPRKN